MNPSSEREGSKRRSVEGWLGDREKDKNHTQQHHQSSSARQRSEIKPADAFQADPCGKGQKWYVRQ